MKSRAIAVTIVLAAAVACPGKERRDSDVTPSEASSADSLPGRRDTAISVAAARPSTFDSVVTFARNEAACARAPIDTIPSAIHLVATPSREIEPEFFCFRAEGATYGIAAEGLAIRITRDRPPQQFQVRVDSGFFIERVWHKSTSDGLYLYYQISAAGDGMGYLDRFAGIDLRPAWKAPASISINLGPALLLGDSLAYVSGLDVAGKVDLRTGSHIWKHILFNEDLAARGLSHFTAFLLPEIRGDTVLFPAWPPDAGWAPPLAIDDLTGIVLDPPQLRGHWPACPGRSEYC